MYIMRVDPDQPLFGPPTIRRSQQVHILYFLFYYYYYYYYYYFIYF